MKLSLEQLKQYISLPNDVTPDKLSHLLSYHVAEIEGYEDHAKMFDNMVIGKIVELKKHPNADKLSVCSVDIGNKDAAQIICGGSNLKKGMLVFVALPGSKVRWHGEGDLITLEETKIRGEKSFGMICASDEVGLSSEYPADSEKEIMDVSRIDSTLKPGTPCADVFARKDIIFEVENKTLSNRPDLWSHYGFARELSAIFDIDLKPLEEIQDITFGSEEMKVTITDENDCLRYMGAKVENIVIGPSPKWLQDALQAVGIKPINNIVDITNYVMIAFGQPMHAFDSKKINNDVIAIRRGKKGEKLELLDDSTIELDNSILVIADDKKALALAGIMGGKNSEISDDTTSIFLEVATFQASLIRKTSTKIGIRTDASNRFEKSLDPYLCHMALFETLKLIKEIIPQATISSRLVDVYAVLPEKIVLETSAKSIQSILGSENISEKFMVQKLTRLGFDFNKKDEGWDVAVPTWRCTKDIQQEYDIAEEVLRMYGYNEIESKRPLMHMEPVKRNSQRELHRQLKNICAYSLGMNEVYNYSFVSKDVLEKLDIDDSKHFELHNPIAKNIPLVQRSLVPNMLQTLHENTKYFERVNIFELARVYLDGESEMLITKDKKDGYLPQQPYHLTLMNFTQSDVPFFEMKDSVQNLLQTLYIPFTIREMQQEDLQPWMHPYRTAQIWSLNDKIGYITELHPEYAHRFDFPKGRVCFANIDVDILEQHSRNLPQYKPGSKFPAIEYDISMFVSSRTLWGSVKRLILDTHSEIIEDIIFLDEYSNEELKEKNQKSLAFRILYQSYEKTLEHDEVQKVHKEVVKRLETKLGATMRT